MITLSIVLAALCTIGVFWIELVIGLICSLFIFIGKLLEKIFTTWWGLMFVGIGIAILLCNL